MLNLPISIDVDLDCTNNDKKNDDELIYHMFPQVFNLALFIRWVKLLRGLSYFFRRKLNYFCFNNL